MKIINNNPQKQMEKGFSLLVFLVTLLLVIAASGLVKGQGYFKEVKMLGLTQPVTGTLVDFSAIHINGKVRLTWQTINEPKEGKFIVQRSAADGSYKVIGIRQTEGNWPLRYSFVDPNPLSLTSHYRIIKAYEDGRYYFSIALRPEPLNREDYVLSNSTSIK